MKHILNTLSEEEKNSIREQHTDKIKINVEGFKSLTESKLGNVKTYLNEQAKPNPIVDKNQFIKKMRDMLNSMEKDTSYNATRMRGEIYNFLKNEMKIHSSPLT